MWSWSNLQSNQLSDIQVTRNDLNLSLNAESELVKLCSSKKAPDERFTDCSSVIHLGFFLDYSSSDPYNLRCFMV